MMIMNDDDDDECCTYSDQLLTYHVEDEDDDQVDAGSRDWGDEAGPCFDDALGVTVQNGWHHNAV